MRKKLFLIFFVLFLVSVPSIFSLSVTGSFVLENNAPGVSVTTSVDGVVGNNFKIAERETMHIQIDVIDTNG